MAAKSQSTLPSQETVTVTESELYPSTAPNCESEAGTTRDQVMDHMAGQTSKKDTDPVTSSNAESLMSDINVGTNNSTRISVSQDNNTSFTSNGDGQEFEDALEALEEANQSKDETKILPAVKPHRQDIGTVETGITFSSIDSPLSLCDIGKHERRGAQPGARSKVKTSEPPGR